MSPETMIKVMPHEELIPIKFNSTQTCVINQIDYLYKDIAIAYDVNSIRIRGCP